jgi:hypothetical protein
MNIVEFGSNSNPIVDYSRRIEKILKSGSTYTGFDIDEKAVSLVTPREGMRISVGDMGKIPLENCSVDEIWVCNVFGENIMNSPGKMSDEIYASEAKKYFREMTRILRTNGKIYIGEWYPRITNPNWLKNSDYSGYGLTKIIYEDKNLQEFMNQHELRTIYTYEDTPPFFIELTKTT